MKRSLAVVVPCALLAVTVEAKDKKAPPPPFTVVEATIPEMQTALAEKRVTSRELVLQYLTRIAIYEDKLNATLTVNPKALEEADARDRERAQGKRARAAARHPDRAQGQHPHDRHADDRRRARVRRLRAAVRGDAHQEPARRPARSSSPRPA